MWVLERGGVGSGTGTGPGPGPRPGPGPPRSAPPPPQLDVEAVPELLSALQSAKDATSFGKIKKGLHQVVLQVRTRLRAHRPAKAASPADARSSCAPADARSSPTQMGRGKDCHTVMLMWRLRARRGPQLLDVASGPPARRRQRRALLGVRCAHRRRAAPLEVVEEVGEAPRPPRGAHRRRGAPPPPLRRPLLRLPHRGARARPRVLLGADAAAAAASRRLPPPRAAADRHTPLPPRRRCASARRCSSACTPPTRRCTRCSSVPSSRASTRRSASRCSADSTPRSWAPSSSSCSST